MSYLYLFCIGFACGISAPFVAAALLGGNGKREPKDEQYRGW